MIYMSKKYDKKGYEVYPVTADYYNFYVRKLLTPEQVQQGSVFDSPADHGISSGILEENGVLTAYFTYYIGWVAIQFRVDNTSSLSVRIKYGNNAWTAYKKLI